MRYDFYTELHPNTTFHVSGRTVVFRSAYFETEDKALALELLRRKGELEIQPGDWAKKVSAPTQPLAELPDPEAPPDAPRNFRRTGKP